MTLEQIYNINILSEKLLSSPQEIKDQLPMPSTTEAKIIAYRQTLNNILERKDPRIFVVVGPCSIHDEDAALDYAARLNKLAAEVSETMFLVMRVYFEKPRTIAGWKGFINDPFLDDSFQIEAGLKKARKLLLDIAEADIPAATEALDPISPQYLGDLISWSAIGARTTESQTHRELSSGLSTPVGFKNGTDGNVAIAINSVQAVSHPHHFLGINNNGQIAIMSTAGNRFAHIILRGGSQPNYDTASVAAAESALRAAGVAPNIMIDCSHGNSNKKPELQPDVFNNCIQQIVMGNKSIIGFMIESNINAGRQNLERDLSKLRYGVSITDGCINWETTREMLTQAHESLLRAKNR